MTMWSHSWTACETDAGKFGTRSTRKLPGFMSLWTTLNAHPLVDNRARMAHTQPMRLIPVPMRLIPVIVLASCASVPAVLQTHGDGTPQPEVTVVDNRIPGGWFFTDPVNNCLGLDGASLPCTSVLNVCSAGGTTLFQPVNYSCSPDSPTNADVCATVPAEQFAFYGLTREECDAITGP